MPTFNFEKMRVGVGVFIQNDQEQVLLEKRRDCGLWCFPGGMLEQGERVQEAAVREVKEETGLTVQIKGLVGIYSEPQHRVITYPDTGTFRLIDIVVRGQIMGGTLQVSPESFDVRFFSKNDLPPLLPRAEEVVKDALNGADGLIR